MDFENVNVRFKRLNLESFSHTVSRFHCIELYLNSSFFESFFWYVFVLETVEDAIMKLGMNIYLKSL